MIPTESNLVTSSIGVETGDADSGCCGTHNTTDEGNELGDSCKEVGIFSMSPSETALFPFLKSNYPHTSKYPVTADTTAMKSEESPLPILQSRLLHQRAVMRSSHDTPSSPDIYLSSPETPVSFHLSSHCSPSEDVKSHSYFHRFGASERYSLFRKGSDLSGMPVSPCTSYGSSLLPLESSSSERASSSKGKGKEALSSPEQSSTSAIAVQRVEGDPALCTKASTVVPELSDYPASPLGSAPSNSSYSIDPCGSPFSSSPRFSPPAVTTTSTTDVHLIVQPQSSSIYPNRLANHLRSRSPTPSPNAFHSTVSFQYTLSESSNMSSPALAENASPPKHTKVSILSLLRRGRSFTRRKGKEKAQSKTSRPSVVHRDTYPQANFATQRSRSGISTGLPELSSLPSPGVGSVDEDLFRPNPIMVNEGSSSRGNAVVVDCPSVVTPDGEVRVDGEDDSSLGSSTIKYIDSAAHIDSAHHDEGNSVERHEAPSVYPAQELEIHSESPSMGSQSGEAPARPSLLAVQRSRQDSMISHSTSPSPAPFISQPISATYHTIPPSLPGDDVAGPRGPRDEERVSDGSNHAKPQHDPRNDQRTASLPFQKSEGSRSESSASTASIPITTSSMQLLGGPHRSLKGSNLTELRPRSRSIPGAFVLLEDIDDGLVDDILQPMEDAEPEPVVDLFTRMLPHELRVEVLRLLVRIHVQEHEEVRRSGQWSFGMATRTGKHAKGSTSGAPARWVGFESGMRELVKLGRVSRSWQALSLDGQLWAVTSFSPFPHIPIPLLVRITKSAGPFMKTLNLRGVSGITADVLMDITENVRAKTATRYDGEEGCNTYSRAFVAQDSRRLHKSSKSRRSHFGSLAIPSTLRATETQLTCINLQGCSSITTKSLHSLLVSSPVVEKLILRGLSAVTNTTCEILGDYFDMSARGRGSAFVPSRLVHLDLGRCSTMDATGIERMIGFVDVNFHPVGIWSRLDQRHQIPLRRFPQLKVLKLGGLKKVTGQTMHSISWGIPSLEVLDLRGSTSITDEDLGELGKWDERYEDIAILASQTRCARVVDLFQDSGVQIFEKVTLTSREMGFNPLSHEKYFKRVTRLKHLCFSSCSRLTDNALSNLAYSVPYLQNLEMGGIGAAVRDTGLVRLIGTTPMIRRVDLEEASEITDTLLDALTPPAPPTIGRSRSTGQPSSHAGQHLEHLVLSYVGNVTDNALLALINGCTKLTCLEVDNTRVSDNVLKEFIRICRQRERKSAEILAVDCRNVTRAVLEGPVSPSVRYRKGWRGWDARSLGYYDERDRGDIMSGIDAIPETTRVGDECNEDLVVMKSFHTWQAVDTMTAARERRRKLIMSRRSGDGTGVGVSTSSPRRDGNLTPRWLNWRSTSVHQAQVAGGFDLEDVDERGCVIM